MTQYECCLFNALKGQLADCQEALENCQENVVPELIASSQATGAGTASTPSMNTTGANFVVVNLTYGNSAAPTLSDNKGNTYILLYTSDNAGGASGAMYYAKNAVTGSGHIITAVGGAFSTSMYVLAFSNMDLDPLDVRTGNNVVQADTMNASASIIRPGSITPIQPKTLIVTGCGHTENASFAKTIDGGYVIAQSVGGNGGGAIAYKTVTDIAAHNPKWTLASVGIAGGTSIIAAFRWGSVAETPLTKAQLLLTVTRGDIVVRGLFKDVAGTIPVTAINDKIACWKDLRTGLAFTQSDPTKQPILQAVYPPPLSTFPMYIVRFAEGQYLTLAHDFGIPVNSNAIWGYYTAEGTYTVFDGPNHTETYTRTAADGYSYMGIFLGSRVSAFTPTPASGKMVSSISRLEAAYNARINGVYINSLAALPTINNHNSWSIGINSELDPLTTFAGDVYGIAIYSTPTGTSPSANEVGLLAIERYISLLYPPPSLALLATTQKGTSAGGGHTDPIDTTGAKLIVLNLAYYSLGSLTGVHDSQGNVYTPLDPHLEPSSGVIQQLWYCQNPLTGVAHQFQINGATIFASVQAAAFAGSLDDPTIFDQQTGAIGTGSSLAIGPIGQSGEYSLVVAGAAYSDTVPGPITGDGGFTMLETTPYIFGAHFGGALAYKFSNSQILHNINLNLGAPVTGVAAGLATFNVA